MMHFNKSFWLISLFLVSNCSFNQIAISSYDIKNYSISSDKSVPARLNTRIRSVFNFSDGENKNAKTKIYIKNFSKQDYSIYAGSALRSLEGEITAQIQLEIQTEKKSHKKDIKIVWNSLLINGYLIIPLIFSKYISSDFKNVSLLNKKYAIFKKVNNVILTIYDEYI